MKNTTKKKKQTKDPYVYFNKSSIENRMRQDLIHFKGDDEELRKESRGLFKGPSLSLFHKMIHLSLDKIGAITEGKSYYDTIRKVEEDKQRQLWIYRTYLFYTFLWFATFLFTHPRIFSEVFSLEWHDVRKELPLFKLGLFGSIKPTSDIDAGLQYNGHKVSELHYIVHCIEDLFLVYTQQSSLDFDIEMYADLLTLYQKPYDRFYLNSFTFGLVEFKQLLPYAFNGILRNILLRKQVDGTVITYDDVYKKLQEYDTTVGQFCMILSISKKQFYGCLRPLFNNSKEKLTTFLSLSYERQRSEYYKKVKRAEEYKRIHYDILESENDVPTIVELIGLMAEALTYRMESYLCAPTIIHIVRVLQANKDMNYARKTADIYCKNIPIHEDPFCSIGLVGFMISLFEQIGYLLRFQDNPDKIKKYMVRVEDAMHHIQKIYNHRIV
jgi:hypothetical protein